MTGLDWDHGAVHMWCKHCSDAKARFLSYSPSFGLFILCRMFHEVDKQSSSDFRCNMYQLFRHLCTRSIPDPGWCGEQCDMRQPELYSPDWNHLKEQTWRHCVALRTLHSTWGLIVLSVGIWLACDFTTRNILILMFTFSLWYYYCFASKQCSLGDLRGIAIGFCREPRHHFFFRNSHRNKIVSWIPSS